MRAAEEAAFARGITAEALMDQAGERIARALTRFFPRPGKCIVFAGKGHNAGDALVAARWLARNDSDAEDIVQDASVRWLQRGDDLVESPRSYLVTIVTRLCMDQLSSARVTRTAYTGPWLPEPMAIESDDPLAALVQADSLSLAFLVLLEELTPTERAAYLQTALELGGAAEEVARVEDVVIPDVEGGRLRARAYWPTVPAEALGVLVWLHGGGWYVGDIASFDRLTRQLANASGAVCLSVEYRLAPEHPYPAAVHDARSAVAWAAGAGARQLGTDPARVVVGGDYDAVAIWGGIDNSVAHSGLPADRVTLKHYPSGHMAYLGDASAAMLARDLRAFVVAASAPGQP